MIGIIARLPQAFIQEVGSRFTAITGGGLVMFLVEIIILYAVVCASIVLVQGVRKVPVQYAKRLVGNQQVGGARQYIPLKLFAANVMPIIFAQALMFIPLAFVQYAAPENAKLVCPFAAESSQLDLQYHLCTAHHSVYLFLYCYHTQSYPDG
jgi:preprotein translocase subunit SecY